MSTTTPTTTTTTTTRDRGVVYFGYAGPWAYNTLLRGDRYGPHGMGPIKTEELKLYIPGRGWCRRGGDVGGRQ